MPTNSEFLSAIFGSDSDYAHVTDFLFDPNDIPEGHQLTCWMGDYFSKYRMSVDSNQYFTISIFNPDEEGKARRRKALYKATHCVVLDDVKEKLSLDQAAKLPPPSWILETSPGSEQWGYILNEPCTDRHRVENLLDGLVANGLAPEGRDPGMKGVTRYVRLPEGVNTKKSKMVDGKPYRCKMITWQPFNRVTLEQLAEPFNVDLDLTRREQRTDGASDVQDHPLIHIPHIIKIKDERSDGRFDITCPWVDEHTGAADDGAAIFTNDDGSIGFKCHHGACNDRTGGDLLKYIEEQDPDFKRRFDAWKLHHMFRNVSHTPAPAPPGQTNTAPPPPGESHVPSTFEAALEQFKVHQPFSEEARQMATAILQQVDTLSEMERQHWQAEVRDHMGWSKTEFRSILNDLRQTWYKSDVDASFFKDMIFIGEMNQFYDRKKRIFYTPDAFQNTFAHISSDARKDALDGGVTKVDRIDYAPKKPELFTENGIQYGNSWIEQHINSGSAGDISPWLKHWEVVGWENHLPHCQQWMAFTLLYPEVKINHMLILGGAEGVGKDFLLYPLVAAIGDDQMTIQGEELLEGYNDYLLNCKYLNINETELGDRREAIGVANKLKPLAAAPPERLRVNGKYARHIKVRNIVNCTMTTNAQKPIQIQGASRRFYAMWTDFNPRDTDDNMKPEWVEYYAQLWNWMKNGGVDHVIYHLRNNVDLSGFRPASPPIVTDFMREIRDSSKSPAQQTIEAFMMTRYNIFACDVLRSDDIAEMLRVGGQFKPELMYIDAKWFTPNKVSMVLKEMGAVLRRIRTTDGHNERLWIVRNHKQYEGMDGPNLYNHYLQSIQLAKKQNPLQVVK